MGEKNKQTNNQQNLLSRMDVGVKMELCTKPKMTTSRNFNLVNNGSYWSKTKSDLGQHYIKKSYSSKRHT